MSYTNSTHSLSNAHTTAIHLTPTGETVARDEPIIKSAGTKQG